MATTRMVFTPMHFDHATAGLTTITASGGVPRPVLAFDAATDEMVVFTQIAPQGLTGALSAILTLAGGAASTNSTYWEVSLEAFTDGEVDIDSADSFDTVNTGNVAMPATQGHTKTLAITLTNADSVAAGDLIRLKISRDANNASDNFAGDAYLLAVEIREA